MIILNLPQPPSTNRLFGVSKSGRRYRKKAYVEWAKQCGWEIVEQKKQHENVSGEFQVFIEVHDRIMEDVDNTCKAILDLLVDMRITDDDKRCRSVQAVKVDFIDRGRCRVMVAKSE